MREPDWLDEEIQRQKAEREAAWKEVARKTEIRKEAAKRERARRARAVEVRKEEARKAAEEARKIAKNVQRAAQIGSRIPGSKLIRDFCACCGEAIRVCDISQKNFCLECRSTEDGMGISLDQAAEHDANYHGDRFYSGEW